MSSVERPTTVLVYNDHGAMLWWIEPEQDQPEGLGPGNIDLSDESLALPQDLVAGFEQWAERYWDLFAEVDATPPIDERREFDSTGRSLAVRLKRHMGEGTRILYEPFYGPKEEIDRATG